MRLRFIHNYRILEILEANTVELNQLTTMCTASGYNYQTKEKWTKCFLQQSRYLPSGFWKDIMELTKADNPWQVKIENLKDLTYDIDKDSFMDWLAEQPMKFTPKWYQAQGAFLALKYRISIGQFATSAGKSFIQYIVCRYLIQNKLDDGQRILMIVPNVMLVKQMAGDVSEYGLDDLVTTDQIYGGSKRNIGANLVISTIDSLANRELEFFEQFGAIIVDEAHKLTTKTYQQVISWVPYNNIKTIYAVSGTFHAEGTYEAMIQKQYAGPILINVGAKQLMDEGSVAPLKIKVLNLRYGYDTCKAYYHADGIDDTATRNHSELKFIRSLASRFKRIANTVSKIEGNQLLLFKTVEYCEAFAEYMKTVTDEKEIYVIHGGIKANQREHIRQRSEEIDNGVICATFATMSTGVSIKRLVWLHLMETSKSFIQLRQSIGRTLRLHPSKDFATVIDYVDIFKKHDKEWDGPALNIAARQGKSRQETYKSEEFDYTIKNLDMQ